MENTTEIHVTTNYNQFRKIIGNREVINHHIERLSKSMEKNGFIGSPIIVNKNLEVIDGQNRLEACKMTKTPVEYIFRDYGDKEMKILNSISKSWTKYDSLNQHVEKANYDGVESDYIELQDFMNKKHPWLKTSLELVGKLMKNGNQNWYRTSYYKDNVRYWKEDFKFGYFKIESYEKADLFAKYIEELSKYYTHSTTNNFASGILRLEVSQKYKFDRSRFLYKLKNFRGESMTIKIGNKKDFINFVNKVYNSRLETYEEFVKFK